MVEFPEAGKKYTIENLPVELPAGKHSISLNGKDVTLLVVEGIPYLNMKDSANLLERSISGLGHRMRKEENKGNTVRYDFGGLEVWVKIEDLKRLFFTPTIREKKTSRQKEWQQ